MARKVFISILGTGNYSPCRYKGKCSETETKYIQEATLNEINVQSWGATDAVYVLLTEMAKDKHWCPKADKGLEAILNDMELPCAVEGVDIPDGKDESEMWTIFDRVFGLLEDGDELYFDLTHAFRYIPMLVLVLSNYAKFLKGTRVAYMSYGNWEASKSNGGVAPIVDLLPLAALQDWTFASGQFVISGSADGISELGRRHCTEIKRKLHRRDDDTDALGSYLATVNSISEKLSMCRGIDLIKAGDFAKMRKCQDEVKRETIPAFGPLISKITDSFSSFSSTPDAANSYQAAKWCQKMNLYQQAVTFLREGVVSVVCARNGLDMTRKSDRDLVDSAFRTADTDSPTVGFGALNALLSDPIFSNAEMVSSFNYLRNLRNDLNHSGMRESPASVKNLKKQIEKAIRMCEPVSLAPKRPEDAVRSVINALAGTAEHSTFINYSNHPSIAWSEEQREAALKFGQIADIPFRSVDPDADSSLIAKAVDEEMAKILAEAKGKNPVVHVMGEMTFTYALVNRLKNAGIRCVASTTKRVVVDNGDGSRTSMFNFVRFRDYE